LNLGASASTNQGTSGLNELSIYSKKEDSLCVVEMSPIKTSPLANENGTTGVAQLAATTLKDRWFQKRTGVSVEHQ